LWTNINELLSPSHNFSLLVHVITNILVKLARLLKECNPFSINKGTFGKSTPSQMILQITICLASLSLPLAEKEQDTSYSFVFSIIIFTGFIDNMQHRCGNPRVIHTNTYIWILIHGMHQFHTSRCFH
jgi:hypothetical protein